MSTLLVIAVCGVSLYWAMHSSIQEQIQSHLSNSTDSILNLVRTSVSTSIKNHLRGIAEKNRDIVSHFYRQAQQGLLSEEEAKAKAAEVLLSQVIGQTGYFFCVDSKGIMQVHPNPAMQGADVNEYPLSKIQIDRKVGYVEYEWANPNESRPREKALYMTYFAPWDWIISASSYRSEFMGLIQLDDFREGVLSHSFGKTGYSFIMTDSGKMLIHPKLEGVDVKISKDFKGNPFPRELFEKTRGSFVYDWVNPGEDRYRKKIAVFESIPELGWIVASTGYLDEVKQPLKLLTYIVAGATVTILVLLFILSWWVAWLATRPLPALIQGFERGARGNLSFRMDERLGSEFGKLATYYNYFMDSLEESQSRLAESEAKYRAIFEEAVEGIFQVSPEKTLVNLNPAMAEIFGYSSPDEMLAEVTDVTTQLYVNPADRDAIYKELFEKGKTVGFSLRMCRRDGSIFWAEMSVRMVQDDNGNIVLVEGILKDVTAQHELMERLAEAKRNAETTSQLKSDFLVMMSHEMRTPLTSILGFARMIRKQLLTKVMPTLESAESDTAKLVSKAATNLDIVESESARLAKLTDNIMDFIGIESGEMVIHLNPAHPKALCERALEVVSEQARSKQLYLELKVDEQLPDVVADDERIVQVLVHLLDNAIKFTSSGGVTLVADAGDNEVKFAVRDTGSGIPAASQENIFDHFTQLGDVLTDKPQGTGLGLALCRSIVGAHRGRIWVESEQGKGSVFYFVLPVAKGI